MIVGFGASREDRIRRFWASEPVSRFCEILLYTFSVEIHLTDDFTRGWVTLLGCLAIPPQSCGVVLWDPETILVIVAKCGLGLGVSFLGSANDFRLSVCVSLFGPLNQKQFVHL